MKKNTVTSIVTYIILMMSAAAVFSFADADEVGARNKRANKLYDKGQYEEALKLYDDALLLDPSNGKLKMNRGSALYRMGELDEAEKSYKEAVSSLSDKKALADAHYNLGNVQYKHGEKLEAEGNAASARKSYAGALENYVNTLKLRPGDKDAKWNLQMAHQKIDMLKEMQDKNQDEQDNKDEQKDENQQGGKNEQDNKEQKDNKEQDNKDQQGNDDKQDQDNKDEQGEDDKQQQQDMGEDEQKREEAERMIEQYADDSDTLNKPRFQRVRIRQPEKDW
jgi:tetratricopeptide (TPR) repeat protein